MTEAKKEKEAMHQDTAATAADWLPYRARHSFSLFELAALLRRQDPWKVHCYAFDNHKRHLKKRVCLDAFASYAEIAPNGVFGDSIGWLACDLIKANGKNSYLATHVDLTRAKSLAAAVGADWPPELSHE